MFARTLRLVVVLTLASGGFACEQDGGQDTPAMDASSPSGALRKVVFAAQAKDVPAFKAGLSRNFQLTIEEYAKLGEVKPELKGAFTIENFMAGLADNPPEPQQEIMKDATHAEVRGLTKDGKTVSTQMVQEDGSWKLEVPPQIAYMISHPEELERIAKNKPPAEPTPDLPTGGGGKGGRLKALAADASDADKSKASALDAFDMGVMTGIEDKFSAALKLNPDDEELVVALGRAQVQKGDPDAAVKTFEAHLKKHPDAVKVHHYLGMGYLMKERYAEAASSWRTVQKLDPAYAQEFKLERRANVAEAMAKGEDLSKFGLQGQQGQPKK